jgi:hypothetical protein
MPVRVNLPDGCEGLQLQDGTRYDAPRAGGAVTVSDDHARWINGGDGALVQASGRQFLGTKRGRWCEACRRLWQVWSVVCPRCGEATVPEQERP